METEKRFEPWNLTGPARISSFAYELDDKHSAVLYFQGFSKYSLYLPEIKQSYSYFVWKGFILLFLKGRYLLICIQICYWKAMLPHAT